MTVFWSMKLPYGVFAPTQVMKTNETNTYIRNSVVYVNITLDSWQIVIPIIQHSRY